MSKYKLNRNWNGHFAGETVTVPDAFDRRISMIGEKIEVKAEVKPKAKAEKPPKNKAIQSSPRNKKK